MPNLSVSETKQLIDLKRFLDEPNNMPMGDIAGYRWREFIIKLRELVREH